MSELFSRVLRGVLLVQLCPHERSEIMKTLRVKFNDNSSIVDFVNTVSKYHNSDFDLCSGEHIVDAKSILGVISMGYGYVRDLKINNSGDDMDKLLGDLKPYIA